MRTIKFPTNYNIQALERWALVCEDDFNSRLSELSRLIVEADKPYIALSGPSCSGKTTTSHKLVSDLVRSGKRVKVISLDDFYLPRDLLLARARDNGSKLDFDSPDTLDWDTLSVFIDAIRQGKVASLPRYDFKRGEQIEHESVDPGEYDLFLFEGIQAAYAAFLDLLPSGEYSAVYVSMESSLKVGERILRPRQLRLARRIVRDQLFRGASPEFTLQLWENVTANEKAHIIPSYSRAHFHIDTLIGYELCVLREPLIEAIEALPEKAVTSDIRLLEQFCALIPSLSAEIVPENALLREFIG